MRLTSYILLFLLGLTLLTLSSVTLVAKSSTGFSMLNPGWDGSSKFATALNHRGELVPLPYPYTSSQLGEREGTLVVVGPSTGFSGLEAEEAKEFLEGGGVIFIADDFGTGNQLLEKLGVGARFSGRPVEDIFYRKNADFPLSVRVAEPGLAGVRSLTLNRPAFITGAEGEAYTSRVSLSRGERRMHPILAEVSYGKGKIVMLSDPGALMNDMAGVNGRFFEALASYLGGGNIYFDESHHAGFNPLSLSTSFVHKELDREMAFGLLLAIAALAVLVESGALGKAGGRVAGLIPRREEDIYGALPGWVEREKLEEMVGEMKTGSRLGEDYGWRRVFEEAERGV